MTNFERIKEMSVEELAVFLSEIRWDSNEPTTQQMYEWLILDVSYFENTP